MQQVNFGIVGLGDISKYYVNAIEKSKNCKIAGIFDLDIKKYKDLKFRTKHYESYESMLKDEKIDSVILCIPNYLHYSYIKKGLQMRKNILCEKPFTLSSKEAEELFYMKKKSILQVSYHRSYNNNFALVLKQLKDAQIKKIHARYLENIYDHTAGFNWYFDNSLSGGGCLIDNGPNVFDTILRLVDDVKIVSCTLEKDSKLKTDTKCKIDFLFKGGNGTIELDWLYHGESKDMQIHTSDGIIKHVDFLKGYTKFKESLWHEYEQIILEFVINCQTHTQMDIRNSFENVMLVETCYNLSKVKQNEI